MPFGYTERYRPPSCAVDELPHVDAVVISHSHFDHLDYQSVLQLNQRYGPRLSWFVPEGLRPWMHSVGCETVVELSWWDEHVFTKQGLDTGVKFACVPAQHWSVRNGWDENKVCVHAVCVRLAAKAPSTPATVSKQRCRMLQSRMSLRQSRTLLRRCCSPLQQSNSLLFLANVNSHSRSLLCYRRSVCLSSLCNVRAPYSAG